VSDKQPVYKRILLKLSGEALMGDGDYGIKPDVIHRMAADIKGLHKAGVEVGIVMGGGNIFRGAGLAEGGMDRVTGDHMGMLATVINGLAMQDALERLGLHVRVMSALRINQVCEDYVRRRANRHLEKRRVCIFVAGTGNPFFTTDSAACLRGIEIDAGLILKATKVDGVYSADPMRVPDAIKYDYLTYDEVLDKKLGVMDLTAICLVRDHDIPVCVFNMQKPGSLLNNVMGQTDGTLIGVVRPSEPSGDDAN